MKILTLGPWGATSGVEWGWGAGGGVSKMKILALSTKLNQISYTYAVDPQKARNQKINHPKWEEGLQ